MRGKNAGADGFSYVGNYVEIFCMSVIISNRKRYMDT